MKIKLFLSLAFACLAASAYSQSISPNSRYSCYTLELTQKMQSVVSLPYASITVVDKRPDTSKAGYYYAYSSDQNVRKVCFRKNMEAEVSSFMNSYINYNTDSANKKIYAYIKKIWFGTYDTTDLKENKITLRTRKLSIKIEFYLNDQSCFYPLYRFDSTYNLEDMPGKQPSFALETGLIASLRKLSINIHVDTRKLQCLSRPQIDSFNAVSGNYPVLQETIAKKGVYMSLDQFRNNQPAYTKFRMRFRSSSDDVIIPGSGKGAEDTVVKAWAVCDGEKMYFRINNNYFALFKSGATYDFYGFDIHFKTSTGNRNTGLGIQMLTMMTSKATKSKPLQVNLENGEVY